MKKLHLFLLYTTIFFLQAYLIRFNIGSYPTNGQEILIALTTLSFLSIKVFSNKLIQTIKNIHKHWVLISFILLTIYSIVASGLHSNLDFYRHLKFTFFAITLSFIFLETFQTAEEREKGIKVMGMGAIMFGIFSAFYNFAGLNLAHDLRLTGPLDAAVYLAFYIAPFFIYFTIKTLQKKEAPILAIAAALILLATKSMGAIAAAFFVILFYLVTRKKLNKKSKAGLALIAIIIAAVIFNNKILPTIQTEYSSLDERGQIWQVSAEFLKEPSTWIGGLGLGQFQENYASNVKEIIGQEPLDYIVLQPHNILLLFIFNYGIFGLIFLLFLIYKISKNETSIFSLIFLYFLIHGLIDTPFFKNDLLILFMIFSQLSLGKPSHKSPQNGFRIIGLSHSRSQ
ncbi:O-antigen ligase family protein [Candidatus Gracilibacteria bacterium]|nr:O-antigen ligase family protein [Candidatus Gracilibacteria bacterium]